MIRYVYYRNSIFSSTVRLDPNKHFRHFSGHSQR